jgi:DNA (cytosine-5)-methyltransferase 1
LTAVEIDPDAASAYEANLGLLPLTKDIRNVSGRKLLEAAGLDKGECTLVFGCPPCQGFSILRRGNAVTATDLLRNALPREYLRLVRAVLPRYLAFENVPGILGRPVLDELMGELRGLGYTLEHGVVDAASYGVPQHRSRLLVVGSRVGTVGLPVPTHGTKHAPHVTVRQAIGDLPVPRTRGSPGPDAYHRARNHQEIVVRRLRAVPEGGGRADLPDDLVLDCHRDHDGHYDIYGRMRWDRPAPTLTSGCTNVTRGRFAHPEQDRAITLREALRLQTFPDDTVLKGNGDEMARQIGNAVPPALAKAIGAMIVAQEQQLEGVKAAHSVSS